MLTSLAGLIDIFFYSFLVEGTHPAILRGLCGTKIKLEASLIKTCTGDLGTSFLALENRSLLICAGLASCNCGQAV